MHARWRGRFVNDRSRMKITIATTEMFKSFNSKTANVAKGKKERGLEKLFRKLLMKEVVCIINDSNVMV
jgi:hypothetical protein